MPIDSWARAQLRTAEMIAALILLPLALLFLAMVGLVRYGRRFGARNSVLDPSGWTSGTAAIEGAVFALMTLLVAFTFSGAANRFAERRRLIVDEANAIQTAYLRLALVAPEHRENLRQQFRRYVDSRIAVYGSFPDVNAVRRELARSNAVQQELWHSSMSALERTSDPRASLLLVPSLNEMIDLTTVRTVALTTHPSPLIFALLGMLALASAFVAGVSMAKSSLPNRLHVFGFSALVTLTLAVIVDFEYPRIGLIRIDAVDELLVDARESMK
jgi:hypothetical protein